MGIAFEKMIEEFPVLYHMAHKDSLASIRQHGLLSTTRLLDLFMIGGKQREQIEMCHRPEYVCIESKQYGKAWIRDQKPMSDRGLKRALDENLTPTDWYRILNQKVFFWTSLDRLETLMGARAYKNDEHLVFEIDSESLLSVHWSSALLCPMNSGCTMPFPHRRGRDTFLPPPEYPFEYWKKKRKKGDAVVEVAIEGGVPDFFNHVNGFEIRRTTKSS